MSGWPHQEIISSGATVAVAPSPTTLFVTDVRLFTSLAGIISHALAGQTVMAQAETSWNGTSGWAPLAALNAGELGAPVEAGVPMPFAFDTRDLRWVRLSATASGGGGSVSVSAQRVSVISTRVPGNP